MHCSCPFLPANPSPSHDLVLALLLQRSASPVSLRPGTNQALDQETDECTAETWGSRGSRRASGRCPLGPQKMWTCLHYCFISEAGQDTCPTTCLAPPLGDLSQDPPLTWSCLRAFWACSGFLYSMNPNPMDNSAPETDRARSRTRAPGGEENEEAGTDQVQRLLGPSGRPLNPLISSCPSWFPERRQPPACHLLLVVLNQPTRLQSHHLRPGRLLINR